MKVKNIVTSRSEAQCKKQVGEKINLNNDGVNFQKQMEGISKSNCAQALTVLADEITKQGNLISEKCDIKELKRYKEAISDFLQKAVNFSFEFDKQSKFDNFGRFKVYANIKKINQKMEQLTQAFLKEQKNRIEILGLVEDIRGLILNIML
ncbi:MAG: YaaR family protein [Firmicutes bacterium]|nr:YaaR family protein [Bacillota bacterium]